MQYDDGNIFARILRGEIPCDEVFRDAHALAFRDLHPQAPVHVLVIPTGAYASAQDFHAQAGAEEIEGFARALALVPERLGLLEGGYRLLANHGAHAGQEVPHYHIHILGGGPLGPLVAPAASAASAGGGGGGAGGSGGGAP